jgi:hypothetical protein
LKLAKEADAILFGAVGDWKYDTLERPLRPEQAILGLRKHLTLFANFRPAILYPELVGASSLKPEIVSGLDILIVRELNGDIYFGQPRGVREAPDGPFKGAREGFDTMRYSEPEIRRIAHVAFQAAQTIHGGRRDRGGFMFALVWMRPGGGSSCAYFRWNPALALPDKVLVPSSQKPLGMFLHFPLAMSVTIPNGLYIV